MGDVRTANSEEKENKVSMLALEMNVKINEEVQTKWHHGLDVKENPVWIG